MSIVDTAPGTASGRRSIMVAALLAIFMQAANIALPNAALLHMAGTLSMSDDEFGWVFTSYIAANAVVLPVTGWLAGRFGRKIVFQVSLLLFAIALLLDTMATTTLQFVFARILQGAAGGTLVPLSIVILLEQTPAPGHDRINLLWTLTLFSGMLSGPPIGGWLSEYFGWQSIFYVSLPLVGFIFLVLALSLTEKKANREVLFDFFGLATFSLGMVGLQMLLDRGERLEWFCSAEIWAEAMASLLGFYLFFVHILTSRTHFLEKVLFKDRNYSLSAIMFFAFGFVLLPTLALTSPMLEELLGYPTDTTGYMTIPRSVALVGALFLSWRMPARLDSRWLIAGGMALVIYGNWWMTGYSPLMDMRAIAIAGMLQGAGLGTLMVVLTRAAFSTLDPALRAEGTVLFNLSRLYGSTLGIAVVQMFVTTNTQSVHLALAKNIRPYGSAAHAVGVPSGSGLAAINAMVTGQAAIVAIVGQFKLLMVAMMLVSPLLLFLRKPSMAGHPRAGGQ